MSDLPADVLKHVVDVHCHPTDSETSPEAIQKLPIKICAMATRPGDQVRTVCQCSHSLALILMQDAVAKLARANPQHVIPCFGLYA